ncbi:MAG: hypothetical protein GX262_00190 [Clostridia bacterium]|jgi:hypothetical protein|nr:hypothetical protein [Clostridia bacterium]
MLPVRDDEHQERFDYSHYIANICLSEPFIALKRELERLYGNSGEDDINSSRLAFQDALYAVISEHDLEFKKPLAMFSKG